jgi:hypothetical protein
VIVLAATIGVACSARVYDDVTLHGGVEPSGETFSNWEMLPEAAPYVVGGEQAQGSSTPRDRIINLTLLEWCPFGVGDSLADLHGLTVGADFDGGGGHSTVAHEMGVALHVRKRKCLFADAAGAHRVCTIHAIVSPSSKMLCIRSRAYCALICAPMR